MITVSEWKNEARKMIRNANGDFERLKVLHSRFSQLRDKDIAFMKENGISNGEDCPEVWERLIAMIDMVNEVGEIIFNLKPYYPDNDPVDVPTAEEDEPMSQDDNGAGNLYDYLRKLHDATVWTEHADLKVGDYLYHLVSPAIVVKVKKSAVVIENHPGGTKTELRSWESGHVCSKAVFDEIVRFASMGIWRAFVVMTRDEFIRWSQQFNTDFNQFLDKPH